MKKIMVVAGGRWQIPMVKNAKEMGYQVLCSNLYEDSPAFRYADEHAVADIIDKEKNLRIAESYGPDAVVTDQSDIAVPTVAYICEQLGLSGIGFDKALLFTNKYKMRSFAFEAGFPSPAFVKCGTFDELKVFFDEYKDIVIKPLDSQSSRGVERITDASHLEELFNRAKDYTHSDRGIIAEQYISGTEFTVDGIRFNDGHKSLIVSKKEHYRDYPNVASELFFSHSDERFDYEKLKRQNDRLVDLMGLPFGLTHAEYIYHDGEYYLIEIAARGGGTNISSSIMYYMTGIDSGRLLIEMALGNKRSLADYTPADDHTKRCCVLKFFDFPPGRIRGVNGLDFLRDNNDVIDFELNYEPGDEVGLPVDDSKRPGFYIAGSEGAAKLRSLMEIISLRVYMEYV